MAAQTVHGAYAHSAQTAMTAARALRHRAARAVALAPTLALIDLSAPARRSASTHHLALPLLIAFCLPIARRSICRVLTAIYVTTAGRTQTTPSAIWAQVL